MGARTFPHPARAAPGAAHPTHLSETSPVNINDLTGKIALVSGGSNGIGAATVRMLAEAGASVLVGYNKGAERAEKLIASLPGKGHRAVNIVLEDSATMRRLAE